ncbi:MAG: hypothetical protein JWM06_1468 [Actinomycetia bacterium]|jgi:hypothetical protein|nr:hypothetical protein [Actinomycetes bacterium]
MPGIFLSHAFADKAFVDRFESTILRSGCGLETSDIFYSSGEDTGVRSGDDLMAAIRGEVATAGLVIAFISPTFQRRPVCIAELGAAWATTGRLFPVLLPGVERVALDGVLRGLLVRYIDDGAALDELRDLIVTVTSRTTSSATWNRFRQEWLEAAPDLRATLPPVHDDGVEQLARRLQTLGMTNFFASRADYGVYRPPGTLVDYLDTAEARIDIAAYWLGQGNELESIATRIVAMLERKPDLTARIAMIDPDGPHVDPVADYLAMRPAEMKSRLTSSLDNLAAARESASPGVQRRLNILTYTQMPAASVIMLDYGTPSGRIQLDFKPFRRPRSESFTFELTSPSRLYTTCTEAWISLVDLALPYSPPAPDA